MSDNQLSLDGIPDEFMQGQIKVECPYLLQMVYELRITRKLNQHGQIWVKGVLQEEAGKPNTFSSYTGSNIPFMAASTSSIAL